MRREQYITKAICSHSVTYTVAEPNKNGGVDLNQYHLWLYGNDTKAGIIAKATRAANNETRTYNGKNGTNCRFIGIESIRSTRLTFRFTAEDIADRLEDKLVKREPLMNGDNWLIEKGGEIE